APIPKAACALTPHPPQSKTLARRIALTYVPRFSEVAKRRGVRWLARNGADTALDPKQTFAVGFSMFDVRCFCPHSQSGVCPHPSPTAVQDAGATNGAYIRTTILGSREASWSAVAGGERG